MTRRTTSVGANTWTSVIWFVLDHLPRLLELGERRWRVTGRGVLGAEVEVKERGRRGLGLLGLQQLDVPSRLLLGVTYGGEVAIVLHPHRGLLEALGKVGGKVLCDLLVQAPLEAVLGTVAEHPQRVEGDGRAVAGLAGEVRLEQVERLAPGPAGERAKQLDVLADEHLVGVEVDDPVARRRLE